MKTMLRLLFLGIVFCSLTIRGQIHNETTSDTDVEKLLVDEIDGKDTQLPVEPIPNRINEFVLNASSSPSDSIEAPQEQGAESEQESQDLSPAETGPGKFYSPKKAQEWLWQWERPEEGDEPVIDHLAQLQLAGPQDITLHFGGSLKDDLFVYGYANTLRTDYHDQDDFIRHRLRLDTIITQGTKKYGNPASEACVRLTNYVFWQKESNYMPFTIDQISLPDLDNMVIAKDIKVKPLIPLIFVEQAFFKLNFDVFAKTFKEKPTFLKVGYFPYIVGRGVTLGYHDDLAVEYLGWAGEGGFTRYPFMPPGILFRTSITKNLSVDLYYNLWRETNASLSDTLRPDRWSRLNGPRPERGSGKNRTTWVTKLDYSKNIHDFGNVLLEPYLLFVNAPEQQIELPADASSKLWTAGFMADWHNNNWSVNIEVAGQTGHQHMHAIDRNVMMLTRSSVDGSLEESFSHALVRGEPENNPAPVHPQASAVRVFQAPNPPQPFDDRFEPQNQFVNLVNTDNNRALTQQDKRILWKDSIEAQYQQQSGRVANSDTFGNHRFRNPYKLSYQGLLAMADISYEFKDHPFKIAAAAAYIGGDNYPYNEEVDKHFNGFIPLRSRYRGLGVQNYLIFDRLVIPRPLNIAYQTMYAFNDLKDLSNLQYVGLGLTWFPYKTERQKLAFTTDLMMLWEAATLNKWDKNGTYPDAAIEEQIKRLRDTPVIGFDQNNHRVYGSPIKFSGWETTEHAHHMLGTEIDLKVVYSILDHCIWTTRVDLFFPGKLYKDLDGQPNDVTRRIDEHGYIRYDSLGHQVAFAFVTGLEYSF